VAPAILNPARFGAPTFTEDFAMLDAGANATADVRPSYRWRTVPRGCPAGYSLLVAWASDCRTSSAGAQGLYTDASVGISPFRTKDGQLTILARRMPAAAALATGRAFATGWLSTKFSFAQRFGYFEMRAMLPIGRGLWPAFWLMPLTDGWPAAGEIDVMEQLGVDGIYYASIHAKPNGREQHETMPVRPAGTTLTRSFHSYGVMWTAREIVFYFDRKEVARRPTPKDIVTPMYLIVNLATGGSWPGRMAVNGGQYVIDRITVWRAPPG